MRSDRTSILEKDKTHKSEEQLLSQLHVNIPIPIICIAIPRASSDVSAHNKIMLTVSFGGSAASEECSDRILEESRDESGT